MTYVTDPLGDLLTRMRNAQSSGAMRCAVPYSKLKHQLCELLAKNEWISGVQVEGEGVEKLLVVSFAKDKPSLMLKRVSKPGRRVYMHVSDLRPVLQGYGMAVLTTNKGLMTDVDARKARIGGEVLCTVA